jgi:hypothetical protein
LGYEFISLGKSEICVTAVGRESGGGVFKVEGFSTHDPVAMQTSLVTMPRCNRLRVSRILKPDSGVGEWSALSQ